MLFKLFQIIQKDELSYSFSEVMLISVPKLGKNRSVSCKILFQLKKKVDKELYHMYFHQS